MKKDEIAALVVATAMTIGKLLDDIHSGEYEALAVLILSIGCVLYLTIKGKKIT